MRNRLLTLLTALALPAALAGCQEPEDPPNPEVAPVAPPVAPEPGMTTGQVPEVVDQGAKPERPAPTLEGPADTAAGTGGAYTP